MNLAVRSLLASCLCLFIGTKENYAFKQDIRHEELLSELNKRNLGIPTGLGVGITQVEAPAALLGDPVTSIEFLPDTTNAQFIGKTISNGSEETWGSNVANASNHATGVGLNLYGNSNSIASGISSITVYEAKDWLDRGWGTGTPPTETNRLQNHSWVAWNQNTNATRRMDFAVERDGFLPIVGLYNSDSGDQNVPSDIPDIYGSIYNGISVGISDGTHRSGLTAFDGTGRTKPEIVAPASFTSFSTPIVTGAAALLIEAAGADTAANDQLTLKAIILAAADKSPFPDWDQTNTRPIDEVYGAGQLDVYEAYFIQNAGQQLHGNTIGRRGWNLDSLQANSSHEYQLAVPSGFVLKNLSALVTWNRQIVRSQIGNGPLAILQYNPSLANLSLELRETGGSSLYVSDSSVDNIEHIWRDAQNILSPGSYTLRVTTDLPAEYALAWRSELFQDYTLWQAANFRTTPLDEQDPEDDPDADGIVNLLEHAFGGDPENQDTHILPLSYLIEENGNTYLEIRFRKPTYTNGLIYKPETVQMLTGDWSSDEADITLKSITPDSGEFEWHTFRRVHPVQSSRQAFVRIDVSTVIL